MSVKKQITFTEGLWGGDVEQEGNTEQEKLELLAARLIKLILMVGSNDVDSRRYVVTVSLEE